MNKVKKAVVNDCLKLIENFSDKSTSDFKVFCEEWKRLHFQYIYSGLNQCSEFIQMTAEFFKASKEILLNQNCSQLDRIGALYLLYSLYFKQPTKEYCKIKLNLENWKILKSFIDELQNCEQIGKQAVYIFYKLLQSNAFRFVAIEYDYGFEDFYDVSNRVKTMPVLTQNIKSLLKHNLKEINDKNKGLLAGIEVLENGYNDMKNHIKLDNDEKIESSQIFDQIKSSFQNIEKIINGNNNDMNNDDHDDDDDVDDDNDSIADSSIDDTKSSKTINEKRSEIKTRAKKTDPNSKNQSSEKEKSGEYDITVIGDFIKMTRKRDINRYVVRTQPISCILNENLPSDIMNGSDTDGIKEKPIPSTSKDSIAADERQRRKRRKIELPKGTYV